MNHFALAVASMGLFLLACSSNSDASSQPQETVPTSEATCDKFLAACNTADSGATYTCDPKAISARSDADPFKQCVQKADRTCAAVLGCFTNVK
jgi:hypothetical protein